MTDAATAHDRRWLALILLAAAQFVVILDASIVNVALPSMGRDLQISQDDLSWVVNGYTLVFGGFLLLGGRMADLFGRRRLFMGGIVLFALASLVGGFAESPGMLVAARAVQGLGAALVSPAALSIVTATFTEGAERNKALGVWGAVAGSGGAIGVLLGGVLTEYLSWEWVLWVNVPIGLVAALVAPTLLAESRDQERTTFDLAGAVSITAGLSLLVYALVNANEAGWGSGQTLALVGGALALLAAFVVIEARIRHPLVPFRIFSDRTRTASNGVGLLIGASLFSMFFFISLYMQQVLGYDALKAGLSYLPLGVTIVVSAGLASQVVNRIGFKPVLVTGLVLIAVALTWFTQISSNGGYVSDILGPSLVVAVGLGLSFVSVTIGATTNVKGDEAGLASGLVNTFQQVGGALGLAVLVAVANGVRDDGLARLGGDPGGMPVALTDGFQAAFATGAGLAAVAAVMAATLIRSADSRAQIGTEPQPVAA